VKQIKNLLKIFNVKTIIDFINLYVALLAIIGLLATIGIFDFTIKPELSLLSPTYVFNMSRMRNIVEKQYGISFPIDSLTENSLGIYGMPNWDNLLPYEMVDKPIFEGGTVQKTMDEINYWYEIGIDDSITSNITNNNSAYRNDSLKKAGLYHLFFAEIQKYQKDLMVNYHIPIKSISVLGYNPLVYFYSLKNKIVKENFNELAISLGGGATNTYSYLSISNKYDEQIQDIEVLINDLVNPGRYKVIGWTALPTSVELITNPPHIVTKIKIGKLDAHQSIEILIKGWKLLREKDIYIGYSGFSNINKPLIAKFMIYLFISVLFIFIMNKVRIKNFTKNNTE
jgi:hypothetical protein